MMDGGMVVYYLWWRMGGGLWMVDDGSWIMNGRLMYDEC